jgi:enoyl-CoA hydratase/carnithine racemase
MPATETRTAEEMMTYEKDVKNKIAYLTLNRPDKMNAPDTAMRIRYGELLRQANADDDVKVVVIRGAGDHFGTGADLPEQQERMAKDPLAEYDFDEDADVKCPPAGSFRRGFNFGSLYASTRGGCRSLQEFKKISIVEVKGYCYGWHFYQAGDADLVISSDDALYGHAAFRYSGWGPRLWTWIETMGLRKFQEMLFTGRPFTAQEMYECNFINSMVPRERLEDEVQKYALACVHNGPTDRIVVQKTFLEMYKQYRGEYMGSILTSLIESLGSHLHADEGEFVLNAEVLKRGLASVVKESEAQFPPEWRLSQKGRRSG